MMIIIMIIIIIINYQFRFSVRYVIQQYRHLSIEHLFSTAELIKTPRINGFGDPNFEEICSFKNE